MSRRHLLITAVVSLVALALAYPLLAVAAGAASISGTVYESDGTTRLSGITVKIYKSGNALPDYTKTTLADGSYQFPGLLGSTPYVVEFIDPSGLRVTEYWNDKTSKATADPITLGATEARTGIDCVFAPASSIRGTVRNAAGAALAGVTVSAFRQVGPGSYETTPVSTTSLADGSYAVSGIGAGTYGLQYFSGEYASPHFRSTVETAGVTDISRCTPVTVGSAQIVTGIDEVLPYFGHVDGSVTSAGGPVPNATVDFYRYELGTWVRQLAAMTSSGADGSFASSRLVPGRYRVLFSAAGFPAQYHRSTLEVDAARDVAVEGDATTTVDTVLVATDSDKPVTSADPVPAGWSNGFTLTLTPDDGVAGSGVTSTHYRIGSGDPTTYTVPVAISAEGSYTVTYWSVDGFGNVEDPKSVEARIERGSPSTSSNIDTDWHLSTVTVTLVPTDTISGVAETWYSIDGAPAVSSPLTFDVGEGQTPVQYWSVDNAGNVETTQSGTVKVDATAPTVSSDATEAPYTTLAGIHVSSADAASGPSQIEYEVDGAPTTVGDNPANVVIGLGTHSFRYRARDVAGNWSSWTLPMTITVEAGPSDTTSPTTTATGIPAGWSRGFTLSLEATDNLGGSGVASIHYRIGSGTDETYTAPVPVSTEGSYTISYWAVDYAGNVETPKTEPAKVDTGLPGTLTNIDSSWHTATFTVTLTGFDDLSGVADTWYRVGSLPAVTAPLPFEVGEGLTDVQYWSVDNAGNSEVPSTRTVKVDWTPPTATSDATTSPYLDSATIHVTSTDGVSGPSLIEYRLDGVTTPTSNNPANVNVALGVHSLDYRARDAAGNWSAWSAPITITVTATVADTTPPVTTAQGEAEYSGPGSITLQVSDGTGSGVVATHYRFIRGTWDQAGSNFGPFPTVLAVPSTPGSYRLEFWSQDAAGNREDLRSFLFTVSEAPATTAITIASNTSSVLRPRPFILSGFLTGGRYLDPVVVYVKKPGKAYWSYSSKRLCYRETSTGADWWYRYTPIGRTSPKGTYYFKVAFSGDEARRWCVSGTIVVRVR